jgi:hypothetical protein
MAAPAPHLAREEGDRVMYNRVDAVIGAKTLRWFAAKRPDRCFYCGVAVVYTRNQRNGDFDPRNPNLATKDHVVPRARGGHKGKHNIVKSCQRCNLMKGSQHISNLRVALTGKRDGYFYGEIEFSNRQSVRP